ncbi:zinc ribbon domain-containing protein [Serratia sp. NFX21]|uniref:zinc ribbon domain-containing protein n=1 Tax=Serratia sp. NFX21 TaxID=3402279 RepID=UPI003AF3B413
MVINQLETRCSYCDEMISSKAKKCKHCGEILNPQLREIESLKRENANRDKSNIVVSNNNNNNNNQGSTGSKRFPHIAHLIMTIITGGLWIFVWLLHYIFRNKENYS